MLCGLEIHQRLAGKKLFNRCPTTKPDSELDEKTSPSFRRVLHKAASEMGQVDKATSFEASRLRRFEYLAPEGFCSLVDCDEEPPGHMDEQALISTLRFAKHIGADIVDEIQVMRKTVVDGSNTSGFQRTSLVATGGSIKSEDLKIPISTLCIEEESCGILPAKDGKTRYRLDRLGIPLIELATEPVFRDPDSALRGAKAIGMALRMLPNVMRGLGTIRQDVNISIDGGARVEIKGLQDIKMLKKLIENEVQRQERLLEIIADIKQKGLEAKKEFVDATKIFSNTESRILRKAIDSGGVVYAARLAGLAGILGKELYENKRYGSEISDYAKAGSGVKGLIHSDEDLDKYRLDENEVYELRQILGCTNDDAFIMIADSEQRSKTAILSAIERAYVLEVPKETRKADDGAGSSFMRPLAGSHRMYPETDVPSIVVDDRLIEMASEKLVSIDEKKQRLEKLLGPQLAEQMIRSHNLILFENLVESGAEPKLAALTLEQTLVALRREKIDVEKIDQQILEELFKLYKDSKITKACFESILRIYCTGDYPDLKKLIYEKKLEKISGDELKDLWEKEGVDLKTFMGKYRLVVDAKELMGYAKRK